MFIDVAKIYIKAGNGGHGAVAFRREKYEPAGGPAGGDGGNGGSVILQVDRNIRTLMDFRYRKHYKAENGEDGKSKMQYGKKGQDLILKVPQGTIVRDAETNKVIADLTEDGRNFVIAKGGRGGKGNMKFTTSTRQAPRFAEGGSNGEELWITLELKLLADVGLVGFPNVGKSTLLSIVTDARPKIADYHFTTLAPNLGVAELEGGRSFVIADIPGLIEGAHMGVGLGHEFLRHIERTRILVHLVDVSSKEGRDPVEDFYKINAELKEYNSKLESKPQIVVANKIDILGDGDGYDRLAKEVRKLGYDIYAISAATGQGIKELENAIWNKIQEVGEPEPAYEITDESKIYELTDKKDEIIIRKEDDKYFVEGYQIEKILNSTNFDDLDSVRYFQKAIKRKGVVDRLKALGINNEDIVNICGYEFEFFD
ncbi:GTPase ObgE [Proteiniborus sp. MB09-C3]|uniref:GTPase ObgE n=1 Tax=Proteiniborus sp. MB09-C3 TaxID=3050072 RepID=UPI0025558D27|nr:GTPase ObgE [Proteiniborus sp. MB09-C3]WIV10615.1 GTPase ObgE [Proteiniborus sp. MB09-C3]